MSSAKFADALSGPRRASTSRSAKPSPSPGLLAAFVREERFGIRLATYARFAALAVIALWVGIRNWASGATVVGYFLGIVGAFALLGVVHLGLSESRYRRAWHKSATR